MRAWTLGPRLAPLPAAGRQGDELLGKLRRRRGGSGGFESHLLGELDLYASDSFHAVFMESPEGEVLLGTGPLTSEAMAGRLAEAPLH